MEGDVSSVETVAEQGTPSSTTLSFTFLSGNPRIEETRGVIHLVPIENPLNLPVERKPLLTVLGVPNHMTYADFCLFCGSFIPNILGMRIIRDEVNQEEYSILIQFNSQESADKFFLHFNGRQFSSLEDETCRILFTIDLQFTGYNDRLEHTYHSLQNSVEQLSCPVCLERLDPDAGGILITICNHSFHCSCISKWTDSSCPVCRYCHLKPEKSTCFICQTKENLWMCIICGFIGCGKYVDGHASRHWKETQHCYSLELETQRVWDYVGDNYVHRLIQSKTDGKLVELNSHCVHGVDGCASCNCASYGISEALLNSKVEAIVSEYNELLATQLENQKRYFENLLAQINQETQRRVTEVIKRDASHKMLKVQTKLDRCLKEKKFLDDLNENLLKNHEAWKEKILELEDRERASRRTKEDRIKVLEEQLGNLMVSLEDGDGIDSLSPRAEIKGEASVPMAVDENGSSSSSATKNKKFSQHKKR